MSFLSSNILVDCKDGYKKIDKKHRIDFWIGIGIGTWTTAILMTMVGYLAADYLNKDMLIGLAIVNPVYFFCMMIGAMKNLSISYCCCFRNNTRTFNLFSFNRVGFIVCRFNCRNYSFFIWRKKWKVVK